MGAVGGSRHYGGSGLGQEGIWGCPSCGADNTGPIAQGCVACGAGRPGRHIGTSAPPPPPAIPDAPETPKLPPTAAAPQPKSAVELWIERHPEATIEQAFTAGYVEGFRDARKQLLAEAPPSSVSYAPEHVINRTIVAALELFRDQVLAGNPEEVTNGEWLSAHQVDLLIRDIKGEVAVHG